MDSCARCGHELGIGRFCANCGHPVDASVDADTPAQDWRSGTAERPAVRRRADDPPVPATRAPVIPPTAPPPPSARFPLFADEVAEGSPTSTMAPVPAAVPAAGPIAGPAPDEAGLSAAHQHRQQQRRRPAWLPWAVGFAVMVLVAGLGAWLLLRGDDQPTPAARPTDSSPTQSTPSPSDSPSASESSPSTSASPDPKPGKPEDVARLATAKVPATAPPNQDTSGNLVRYEARNMLDGVASTCWRMPGDGTGKTITFDLDQPTTLSEVGLINGYAKTATDARGEPLDWYHGNRRILTVEWTFDDGTAVRQSLTDTRDLQTVDVKKVTTSTVQLRLLSVSAPGKGRAARNYTPISDVSLVGRSG